MPVAVTAFTAEALDQLNVEDLGDLDAQVPNLTIYAARGSSSTITAYIRGVGQSDPLWGVDPGVGIYLDDVYIARPQGALLDVFDVERIEVLRGPQGTLYGKNTIGGAIKYISRGLPTSNSTASRSITVGNYNQLDVKAASAARSAATTRCAAASRWPASTATASAKTWSPASEVSDKEITRRARPARRVRRATTSTSSSRSTGWTTSPACAARRCCAEPNALRPRRPSRRWIDRYDVRNGMPNINDTDDEGRVGDGQLARSTRTGRSSTSSPSASPTPRPTSTSTRCRDKIADVKAFYSDEQVSNELQVNYDAGGRARGVMGLYSFDGEAGGQVLNNFFNLSFGDTQGTVYTESIARSTPTGRST